MFLKKQTAGFLFGATAICAAILFFIFSSYLSAAFMELPKEKEAGFSSSIRLTDDASLYSSPVTVPTPAVFAKKGHSSRSSVVSKFIQLVPQVLWVSHPVFCNSRKPLLKVPPIRLHLALRVMRI